MPVPKVPKVQRPEKPLKAEDACPETLQCCNRAYSYLPNLTKSLDNIKAKDVIDQARINEIVLWKINRYAEMSPEALAALDAVKTLRRGQHNHQKAKDAFTALLLTKGINVAMASSILRMRNPKVFQIFDGHAYRTVMGEKMPELPKPASKSDEDIKKNIEEKFELYTEYMDTISPLATSKGLKFKDLDRALYVYDKKVNRPLNPKEDE
ncbi:hypothetical protein ACKF11_13605 [Methylobacillus sp. Pita2]|uniref:hypothetical protein n=1 Tax=Methylobacillus sp. Pita2 TaxID=3383245 RepID=UPI0038B6588D